MSKEPQSGVLSRTFASCFVVGNKTKQEKGCSAHIRMSWGSEDNRGSTEQVASHMSSFVITKYPPFTSPRDEFGDAWVHQDRIVVYSHRPYPLRGIQPMQIHNPGTEPSLKRTKNEEGRERRKPCRLYSLSSGTKSLLLIRTPLQSRDSVGWQASTRYRVSYNAKKNLLTL